MSGVKLKILKKEASAVNEKKAKEAAAAAAVLKAAADAAAEVERKHAEVLAAAAKEEARIATERRAEEQERLQKSATRMNISGTDEKMKDIFVWLHSIPFSRRLVKIERDFSDGTLIAEIVRFYCPKLCSNQHYFPWLSSVNKISNWMLLNYKVFPKLGFRLNDHQIKSLVQPFSCGKFEGNCDRKFIFTLLKNLQEVLAELNPKVLDYKKKNFVPPKFPTKYKRFVMYKKRKVDKSMPTYSKVERMLEDGFYDKDKDKKSENDKDKEPENEAAGTSEPERQLSYTSVASCSCPNIQKRYTTVDDETTIFLAPSSTYFLQPCMKQDTSCVKDDSFMMPETCYSCFYL